MINSSIKKNDDVRYSRPKPSDALITFSLAVQSVHVLFEKFLFQDKKHQIE